MERRRRREAWPGFRTGGRGRVAPRGRVPKPSCRRAGAVASPRRGSCDPLPRMKDDAFRGFLAALAVAAAVTPLVARLARRVGAVDTIKDRGLAGEPTPLLGGLAIFAGV